MAKKREKTERQRLVDQVLHAQDNAKRKIRRNEANGIHIRNTELDPTRTNASVRRMSMDQLREHLERLGEFRSRDVQFSPAHEGIAVRRETAKALEEAIERKNQLAAYIEARYAKDKLAGVLGDGTVQSAILEGRMTTGINATQRVLQASDAKAVLGSVRSQKRLEQVLARQQKLLTNEGLSEVVNKRFNSILAGAGYSGNGDLIEELKDLTDEEKLYLMDYTTFDKNAALNINSDKYYANGMLRPDWNGDDTPGMQDEDALHQTLSDIISDVKARFRE